MRFACAVSRKVLAARPLRRQGKRILKQGPGATLLIAFGILRDNLARRLSGLHSGRQRLGKLGAGPLAD